MPSREAVELIAVHEILKQNDIRDPKLGKVMGDMRRHFVERAGIKFDWKEQYDSACATLRASGTAKFVPSLEKARRAFTPDQQEMMLLLRDPTLVFVPDQKFSAMLKAIRGSGLVEKDHEIQRPFSEMMKKDERQSSAARTVQPMVMESTQEIKTFAGDDPQKSVSERAQIVAAIHRVLSMQPMTKEGYTMLALDHFRKGTQIDKNTLTILDAESTDKDTFWAGVEVYKEFPSSPPQRQMYFGFLPNIATRTLTRFRSTVSGRRISQ